MLTVEFGNKHTQVTTEDGSTALIANNLVLYIESERTIQVETGEDSVLLTDPPKKKGGK